MLIKWATRVFFHLRMRLILRIYLRVCDKQAVFLDFMHVLLIFPNRYTDVRE